MKYKQIIFDFDGVLAETNNIRFNGFVKLFKDFSKEKLDHFIDYIRYNGGLSRYKKIQYFFNKILQKPVSDDAILEWAERYSRLVKESVIKAKPVEGSLDFLENYASRFEFSIVSGSDQEELRSVCSARKIKHYFVEIMGSPPEKDINIANLLIGKHWKRETCLYVGDSINDYDAARKNGIDFIGRNSGLIDWRVLEDVKCIDTLNQLYALVSKGCQRRVR